jgi:hypothetical protein
MQLILNTTKLVEIFVNCDDFMIDLEKLFNKNSLPSPDNFFLKKERLMTRSEMMSIVIFYHYSGFKCFKYYYKLVIKKLLKKYFPKSFSYSRFIQLMPELNFYLGIFMNVFRLAPPTEANYIDSKKLVVCHNRRIKNNKVFKDLAKRGKSSTGWFFGFKLHLVINHLGEIICFKISQGNLADNNHNLLKSIANNIQASLFGDKGYISKIASELKEKGLDLITKLRKNMKPKKLSPKEKYYLKHRGLIETVFDILKHTLDIEHSRNRSQTNYFVNVLSAVIAYTFYDNNPSIPAYQEKMNEQDFKDICLIEI